MIIDTESPDGRALVALAKFGRLCFDEADHYGDLGGRSYGRDLIRLGLATGGPGALRETDLAKLPEGI